MFTVAGVSTLKGEVKVRFANDMTRVKVLVKGGHTDVELIELPQAMDKAAVVKHLMTTDIYKNPAWQAAIDAADAKYSPVATVKVKAEKPAKGEKTKTAKSKVIVTKPSMEDLKARAAEAAVAAEADPVAA